MLYRTYYATTLQHLYNEPPSVQNCRRSVSDTRQRSAPAQSTTCAGLTVLALANCPSSTRLVNETMALAGPIETIHPFPLSDHEHSQSSALRHSVDDVYRRLVGLLARRHLLCSGALLQSRSSASNRSVSVIDLDPSLESRKSGANYP